ncbi:MAG: hypothetical protein IJY14_01945 [Acholeplasmatales bacterium]|nr:hypothetical protein [Acholeplasmatales bacterium]
MKRIHSQCILQTLHFVLDPNVSNVEAIEKVKNEVAAYKAQMGNRVKIVNEIHNPDGTVVLSIKKAVTGYSIGNYFD